MKWIIRNQPGLPVFDTREEAIAEAWAMTAPGKNRPKVDGVEGTTFEFHTSSAGQLTITGFTRMGEAAAKAAEEFRGMMLAIEGVKPETLLVQATEKKNEDYNIVVRAVMQRGPKDESSEPHAASPTSAG